MKIEKLSKKNFIKTSIIVLVVISIFGVIFINRSKAKYRVTQSIQIVNGTVNYKPADLNVVSLNVEETAGSGNYTKAKVPTTGSYKINTDKTYCTVGSSDTQLKTIPIEYKDGKLYIGINDTKTKCYVWLDKQQTLADKLIENVNSTQDGCPAYEEAPSITTIEDTKSLLCKGIDNDGKDTYYYRGNVTNNWVKIGNFYWRIIRFNGNGSIRLIYSGNGSAKTSGTGTQLSSTSVYNNSYANAKYVKYMDDNMDNSTLKNPKNSNIKQKLDNWYDNNLKSTYGSIMDGEAGFCNDADVYSSGGTTYFKPYNRLKDSKKPTFKCDTKSNLFTTSGNSNGNEKLTNSIGLITADEVSYAGGVYDKNNKGYYLYTNQAYWTMSPYDYYGGSEKSAYVFIVHSGGDLAINLLKNSWGVRPVINLKADTQFKEGGDGSSTNPYEVVI